MTVTIAKPVAGRFFCRPGHPLGPGHHIPGPVHDDPGQSLVTMALPAIRRSLHASIQSLEWTVNAYTLTFAVLLLTGAALGDRFGRRRMFVIGLAIFTAASAAAALSPDTAMLIAARAVQGAGAAIVLPLTLTLLSEATPPQGRGMALGIWSGVSGLGVAIGPLAGGAVVQGLDWHWIFWINVPVGVALLPLARTRLAESRGPSRRLDLPGLALAGAGLLGVTYAVVRGQTLGWTSAGILAPMAAGVAGLDPFAPGGRRRAARRCCPCASSGPARSRRPTRSPWRCTSGCSGRSSCWPSSCRPRRATGRAAAGLRTLPWTAMPILVALFAGMLSDRIGSRPLLAAGLALQATAIAWLAVILSPDCVLPAARGPVRAGGDGHGPGLRARGQHGPRLGRPRRGPPGVRCHERHQGVRRRPRRRRPRLGVQRARLLRDAVIVCGRADRRAPGWGGVPRRGRGHRAARPSTPAGARVADRVSISAASSSTRIYAGHRGLVGAGQLG